MATVASVEIPNRSVFRAAEVCELAGVPAYVLRGWEAEFPDLGVAKTAGAPRVYRKADVEEVLRGLGAEFFFTGALIQPGRPVVFGRIGKRHVFGLPGNPVSTMVTFEVFARAALELASRAWVMESGEITLQGEAKALLGDERVRAAYLGE